jgi:hypothetical protein
MKRAWADQARAEEVREAARGWKEAEAIDGATLAAIETAYPGPKIDIATGWKVLVFILVTVAIVAIFMGVFSVGGKNVGARFFGYGVILAAATELLRGSKLAGTGADAATSFWGVFNLLVGFGELLEPIGWDSRVVNAVLLFGCLAFAAASWRWGFGIYGAFATVCFFGLLARVPSGRLLWFVVGGLLAAGATRLIDREGLAPPYRRAFAGVFAVSAMALYAACNVYSFDRHLVELLRDSSPAAVAGGARILFVMATALVPVLLVIWGLLSRRRLILDTGAVLAAASILTLHHYARFGALWIAGFGLALIGAALWLNRLLRRAPAGEKGGFTASALYTIESAGIGPAAAIVAAGSSLSPPAQDRGEFTGGGGQYGGGGASGNF